MLSPSEILEIRANFPILCQEVYQKPWIYLDNAATTQKPSAVINAIDEYYLTINANVHRGVHYISNLATEAMEQSREHLRQFINASNVQEIIFTKGTTESINLISVIISDFINEGDEIILSELEHHSNIVPWQMLCQRKKARLRIIPIDRNACLNLECLDTLLNERTRLVAVNHVSNALGVINPVRKIIKKAHEQGAWVLIDGAQAISHSQIDVRELGVDFYAFSAHKMYGPTGVGALYGKRKLLERFPPWQGGGEMIKEVSFEKTLYAELPFKLEAGTPNIAGIIAWEQAFSFLEHIGMERIKIYETYLLDEANRSLQEIPNLLLYANRALRSAVTSFNLSCAHPFDVGSILDRMGIAVRTGHHCAQPLMRVLNAPGTVRASFAVYNTLEEVEKLCDAVGKASKMLIS
ncbi:aminotransferase class V-fold PLP-dependent enzyme [Bacteroidetes bacterium endosymbiont of Geopemphigus sp.]|uniref:aminotransferase class V-fold PLP-dependent enzyme n=1 Tax=Bacteroidetes bacterium endosymbiont of Geopemphigus sp. TaxID=2047937 RepID=UPI000CD325A6|nr:SufS family cysteine desulfurase [Bacteroidetes bacterium endosymbiont of Geopemphigus sp.]